jgi:hypothetical protein
VLTHASYSLAGGSLPPPAPPLGNLNKVILSEKKQERCYDLDTVQAGMPMTVKVMGKQALACFPSLVWPVEIVQVAEFRPVIGF